MAFLGIPDVCRCAGVSKLFRSSHVPNALSCLHRPVIFAGRSVFRLDWNGMQWELLHQAADQAQLKERMVAIRCTVAKDVEMLTVCGGIDGGRYSMTGGNRQAETEWLMVPNSDTTSPIGRVQSQPTDGGCLLDKPRDYHMLVDCSGDSADCLIMVIGGQEDPAWIDPEGSQPDGEDTAGVVLATITPAGTGAAATSMPCVHKRELASMKHPRSVFAAGFLLGGNGGALTPTGRCIVAGGANERDGALKSAEMYHMGPPAEGGGSGVGSWQELPEMSKGRLGCFGVALPDGRFAVYGGGDGRGQAYSDGEAWDPATNRWAPVPSLNYTRWQPTLCTATTKGNGVLALVIGGVGRRGVPPEVVRQGAVEILEFKGGQPHWRLLPAQCPLPHECRAGWDFSLAAGATMGPA
jgi:hypothetical protein